MPKRIIFFSVILCLLLTLSSCGHAEVTTEDTLETMYSVSDAFLNVHYGVMVSQVEEFVQLNELKNSASPPPLPGMYDNPDFAGRLEGLIRQKYQTQPLTDKGLKSILLLPADPVTLWKLVLSTGSDIKITSVKTSLRNTDIDDEKNDINYTVNLLINNTSHEVTGVLTLVFVDDKWQIDDIYEFGWSPLLSY